MRVVAHVLSGVRQIRFDFPRLSRTQQQERVRAWARETLQRLGISLTVIGEPPMQGPALIVCNHISWLDIVVLHALTPCRFVSKAEVKRWPLVGILAAGGATLFVERKSRRDAMRVVHDMAGALKEGDILAIFPEGTTGDGSNVLPFHANLLQAAISTEAPAHPVALQFREDDTNGPSRAVSYVGDESLVGSVWRTLSARGVRATVAFGAPQRSDGRPRRAWAEDLRQEVAALRERQP